MKIPAIQAAKQFVATHFPQCSVALLTGSTTRGEETPYSDLDIIVISDDEPSAYAEAYYEQGWMIEILMHNRTTYKEYFKRDCLRGRPSLPHMFATGVILFDDGTAVDMIWEARQLLEAGPPPWSEQEIRRARFTITNHLLDLQGGLTPMAASFAIHELAHALHELVLRTNGHWTARGKRIPAALEHYDPAFSKLFDETLQSYSLRSDVAPIIHFADETLACYGGRLFEGYSSK